MSSEPEPIERIPVYHDGNAAWVVRFADEDGRTVCDLDYVDGRKKWCYWPSPRITARTEAEPVTGVSDEHQDPKPD